MKIEKIINKVAQENTYLLSTSHSSLIIDPGSEPDLLLEKIPADRPVSSILLTHAHFDHIMGLSVLKKSFPEAKIYLHELEKEWMKNPQLNASALLTNRSITAPVADRFYTIDESYNFDGFHFRVLYTPGHSMGGVSLFFEDDAMVFSGDALFQNTVGRWDLPTGNQRQLLDSIRNQLFNLDDDIQVFPGHGPSTTIGRERLYNPFFN